MLSNRLIFQTAASYKQLYLENIKINFWNKESLRRQSKFMDMIDSAIELRLVSSSFVMINPRP